MLLEKDLSQSGEYLFDFSFHFSKNESDDSFVEKFGPLASDKKYSEAY